MIEIRWTLFEGRAGGDTAQVWLEPDGEGAVLRSRSWGPGVERYFGSDTIETSVRIDGAALFTLAAALVMDRPELDSTAPALDTLAAAYRGDSAATSRLRARLDELGLPCEFTLR